MNQNKQKQLHIKEKSGPDAPSVSNMSSLFPALPFAPIPHGRDELILSLQRFSLLLSAKFLGKRTKFRAIIFKKNLIA